MCYWQASQASGLSSEQASAAVKDVSSTTIDATVVLAILVAGRERK